MNKPNSPLPIIESVINPLQSSNPRAPNPIPGPSRSPNPPNPTLGPPSPPSPPKALGPQRPPADPMNSKLMKKIMIPTFLVIISCSIVLIVYGSNFIEFYFLDKLETWLYNAMVLPFYMITLGSVTLVLGLIGVLLSLLPNGFQYTVIRKIFALFLAVAFIGQIALIYINVETRINSSDFDPLHKDLKRYGQDKSITSDWNKLQSNFHCCGANGYKV